MTDRNKEYEYRALQTEADLWKQTIPVLLVAVFGLASSCFFALINAQSTLFAASIIALLFLLTAFAIVVGLVYNKADEMRRL